MAHHRTAQGALKSRSRQAVSPSLAAPGMPFYLSHAHLKHISRASDGVLDIGVGADKSPADPEESRVTHGKRTRRLSDA